MSDGSNPTEEQKNWLARIFGESLWTELTRREDFLKALDRSLGEARRIGLRYLADKRSQA